MIIHYRNDLKMIFYYKNALEIWWLYIKFRLSLEKHSFPSSR